MPIGNKVTDLERALAGAPKNERSKDDHHFYFSEHWEQFHGKRICDSNEYGEYESEESY